MTKILFSLLLTIGLSSSAMAQTTTITKFNGAHITGIELYGKADIKITQGANTCFAITLPKEYENKMILKLYGNKIKLSWAKGTIFDDDKKVTIDMVCNSLEDFDASGGMKVHINGTMITKELEIDASGVTDFTATSLFVAGKLDIDVAGSTKMSMEGKAKECKLEVSGSGNIKMSNLEATDMDVEISGDGNCQVWATDMLEIDASGAAKVGYKGNPIIKNEVSGRASIYKL